MASSPDFKSIFGFHPRSRSFELSINFLGVPSGFEVSHLISPEKPTIYFIAKAKSFIDISFEEPTFKRLCYCLFSNENTIALAKSSTCKNSLKGDPVPHNKTS